MSRLRWAHLVARGETSVSALNESNRNNGAPGALASGHTGATGGARGSGAGGGRQWDDATGMGLVMEVKVVICRMLKRVLMLHRERQLQHILHAFHARHVAFVDGAETALGRDACAEMQAELVAEFEAQTRSETLNLQTMYPLDVMATFAQLLPREHPPLVARALEMLQLQSTSFACLLDAVSQVHVVVEPASEHVFHRFQHLLVLLRERVETSEDWLSHARGSDRETSGQVEYILLLITDMCFAQFGKLGQGRFLKSGPEQQQQQQQHQQHQQHQRRSGRRSSSGSRRSSRSSGEASRAQQEQERAAERQARMINTIRHPMVRRWAAALGPRWRAEPFACDTIHPGRQAMLLHLGFLPLVLSLIKDASGAWQLRQEADQLTRTFTTGVKRLFLAAFAALEVFATSHAANQAALFPHVAHLRELIAEGFCPGTLLASILQDNAVLCRGVDADFLRLPVDMVIRHGRRPQYLAPLYACVAPSGQVIVQSQKLVLQLLLERMSGVMDLVYDRTTPEVRRFWNLCTRKTLAVVLRDLYHTHGFGTPWYDEWVGQFLPQRGCTNVAPRDRRLHPVVDVAPALQDLYETPDGGGGGGGGGAGVDSDDSASTVDWDTMREAREVLYHIRLLNVLCACTAGLNHDAEAKCQAVLGFEKLVSAMMSPSMPLLLRLTAHELVVEAWLDVSQPAAAVKEESFAHLLITECRKLRQPSPLVQLQGRPKRREATKNAPPSPTVGFSAPATKGGGIGAGGGASGGDATAGQAAKEAASTPLPPRNSTAIVPGKRLTAAQRCVFKPSAWLLCGRACLCAVCRRVVAAGVRTLRHVRDGIRQVCAVGAWGLQNDGPRTAQLHASECPHDG